MFAAVSSEAVVLDHCSCHKAIFSQQWLEVFRQMLEESEDIMYTTVRFRSEEGFDSIEPFVSCDLLTVYEFRLRMEWCLSNHCTDIIDSKTHWNCLFSYFYVNEKH